MRKLIACLLALCLFLPAACAEGFTYEGPGYDSPEEAALAYANAFARGDVMEMISTFTVETYVDQMDVRANLISRHGMVTSILMSFSAAPSYNDYARQLRVMDRVSALTDGFSQQYFVLSGIDKAANAAEMEMRRSQKRTDEIAAETADAFLEQTADCAWPQQVEVGRVWGREISEAYDWGADYDAYFDNLLAVAVCDEATTVAAELQIDGVDYLQVLQCVRYGEKWYIESMTGFLFTRLVFMIPSKSGFQNAYGLLPADEVKALMQ